MHNVDQVVESIEFDLIRMKMKASINPPPKGKDLIAKAHKVATQFLYDTERYE